jgi:hypothetical protein
MIFQQGNAMNIVYLLIGLIIYFYPSVLSYFNRDRGLSWKVGFFIINLLFGWTVIVWLILIFKSGSSKKSDSFGQNDDNYTENYVNEKTSYLSNNQSTSQPSTPYQSINEDRETVEIQFQQKDGNWRTQHVTHDNLDQTISHGMESVQNIISQQSGNTGRVRARGKKSGRIYDIN